MSLMRGNFFLLLPLCKLEHAGQLKTEDQKQTIDFFAFLGSFKYCFFSLDYSVCSPLFQTEEKLRDYPTSSTHN